MVLIMVIVLLCWRNCWW